MRKWKINNEKHDEWDGSDEELDALVPTSTPITSSLTIICDW